MHIAQVPIQSIKSVMVVMDFAKSLQGVGKLLTSIEDFFICHNIHYIHNMGVPYQWGAEWTEGVDSFVGLLYGIVPRGFILLRIRIYVGGALSGLSPRQKKRVLCTPRCNQLSQKAAKK